MEHVGNNNDLTKNNIIEVKLLNLKSDLVSSCTEKRKYM